LHTQGEGLAGRHAVEAKRSVLVSDRADSRPRNPDLGERHALAGLSIEDDAGEDPTLRVRDPGDDENRAQNHAQKKKDDEVRTTNGWCHAPLPRHGGLAENVATRAIVTCFRRGFPWPS
jgi:hypothetical protein